jgi:gluconate 2-dehydrogenase gamma chain
MKTKNKTALLTRRQFVAAGALGSAALAIGCKTRARESGLSEDQMRTLAAICDQIVPADDFPSASEAGVLTYIDRQLARHYRRHRDAYRAGLEQADAMSKKRYGREVAALSGAQQLEAVKAIEREAQGFFELVRSHTLEGYYGTPRHGGNRDEASWRMLGLPDPPLLGRSQYDLRKGSAQ